MRGQTHSPRRQVRCPHCRQVYHAQVSPVWYMRQLRRTGDYPALVCWPCDAAAILAAREGGAVSDYRNPEQVAF